MNYDILTVIRGPELISGGPIPGLTNAAPLPASEIRLDRMQFASLYDSRVNLNGYGCSQMTLGNAGSDFGILKQPHQHFLWNFWVLSPAVVLPKFKYWT
jgi:hypothetical protein